MKKRKRNEINKWDVFYNKKRNHPSINYGIKNDDWLNFDISHVKDKNHRYEMKRNPNSKDKSKSYLKKGVNRDKVENIGHMYYFYKICKEDRRNINKFYKNKKR